MFSKRKNACFCMYYGKLVRKSRTSGRWHKKIQRTYSEINQWEFKFFTPNHHHSIFGRRRKKFTVLSERNRYFPKKNTKTRKTVLWCHVFSFYSTVVVSRTVHTSSMGDLNPRETQNSPWSPNSVKSKVQNYRSVSKKK